MYMKHTQIVNYEQKEYSIGIQVSTTRILYIDSKCIPTDME